MATRTIDSAYRKFVAKLGETLDAEQQGAEMLREFAENASDQTLKLALEQHAVQTDQQVIRLEQVFDILGEKPLKSDKSTVFAALRKDADKLLNRIDDEQQVLIDDAIGVAALDGESLEVSCYLALVGCAQAMGENQIADLLSQTLNEEQAALAQLQSNLTAMAARAATEAPPKGKDAEMAEERQQQAGQQDQALPDTLLENAPDTQQEAIDSNPQRSAGEDVSGMDGTQQTQSGSAENSDGQQVPAKPEDQRAGEAT